MLNTQKFLYIMADAAFVAELLPTKKAHTFAIQVFRQINGEFLVEEDTFITEHIDKLFSKVDPDEYQLVLPDELFTNTIVDCKCSSATQLESYVKKELLPSLELTTDTHQIKTSTLTQFKDTYKVQLSALESSLLAPLQQAAEAHGVKIQSIVPLTWTLKSIISLEPSLSIAQIGGRLYLAQHYIGIDQALSFPVNEVSHIIEAVKTLKGSEPNIQTVYLLTNGLIEEELKRELQKTLPLQQLAPSTDEQDGMPNFIRHIIESGARTLDIEDFPVPHFLLGKSPSMHTLPSPITQDVTATAHASTSQEEMQNTAPTPLAGTPEVNQDVSNTTAQDSASSAQAVLTATPPTTREPVTVAPPVAETPAAPLWQPPQTPTHSVTTNVQIGGIPTPLVQSDVIPLNHMQETQTPSSFLQPSQEPSLATSPQRVVLKNKSEGGSLLKIIGITLAALIITVALGVGIGFGLLSLSEKKEVSTKETPVVQVQPSAAVTAIPSPSPSASASATVAKDKVKILVVNATKIAGKAGKVKTSLVTAGYTQVETGNALGTYATPGSFILMKTKDQAFIDAVAKATTLSLSYQADKSVEDAKSTHDVVIVLNE